MTQVVTQVVNQVVNQVEVTRWEWLGMSVVGGILCRKQEEEERRPALHAVPAWAQRACPAVILR